MKYLLSAGSNVGDRFANFEQALSKLKEKSIFVKKCSSFYSSTPVDYLYQANFLNVSLLVETNFEPQEMLQKLKEVENEMGRVKSVEKGPRKIDLDIIFWEKGSFSSSNLTIPHKEAERRLFVIVPTLELLEKSSDFKDKKAQFQLLLEQKKGFFSSQRIEKLQKGAFFS